MSRVTFGFRWLAAGCCLGVFLCAAPLPGAELWQVGVGKVDITPDEAVRLSGYAGRVASASEIADPLSARALVISPSAPPNESAAPQDAASEARTLVLVSIDAIGVSNLMTVSVASWLEENYSIPRANLVISSTHSHATPHQTGLIPNLYPVPSTAEQIEASARYTEKLHRAIEQAIVQAIESRAPATLALGEAQADFVVNRRALAAGTWTGFGEQTDGPADRRVRLLVARSSDEQKIVGAAYMYACHCTTLGGDLNRISGDWAGLSASRLEMLHTGSVWLPIIGCGADANPHPRGTYALAERHAAELVTAIEGQLSAPDRLTQLDAAQPTTAYFGYAGLAPEQPSGELIAERAASEDPTLKSWAEIMQRTLQEMGRLPETYPLPIHTWQFGDTLTWVFLGGEVVVDYQLQLEKELPTAQTWVAAYCDDVFAYIASERMRAEGGYEVDSSMLYYGQPGRWQSGTQSLIVRRVREIAEDINSDERGLTADEALRATRVSDGYHVDLVAAEPLVQDPINLAFGIDGRVWVVEMSDYPLGVKDGGRVKWLRDQDGDGRLDQVQDFLDKLSYPTSVMPWRDGTLVIVAPDILFAHDEDGDGRADRVEKLLTGIEEANPQHRASGFDIGLDGWLHLAAGHGTQQLLSHRNGQTYDVQGSDVAWNPDSGEIRTTAGETQFVRGRDAFGNWFGNSNSLPMYQYVIEDRYVQHASVAGGPRQDLLTPAVAPPVYPRSRTVDRFNDLYAHNRFTSACSSIVVRVPGVSKSPEQTSALICEPVHNLVARIELSRQGSSFTATHEPDAQQFDFFTSTDLWSRPVRAINAPDGTIWIVDMVRRVIEHPEWIPTAWQERLDLRAGSKMGRIYRISRDDFQPSPLQGAGDNSAALLEGLASENGALRDLVLQAIIQGEPGLMAPLQTPLRALSHGHASSAVRASALGCLLAKNWLKEQDVVHTLQTEDPRLVSLGLQLAENFTAPSAELAQAISAIVPRNLGLDVDLQWVLTASLMTQLDSQTGLAQIAARASEDSWILKAFSLLHEQGQALAVTEQLLERWNAEHSLSPHGFAEVEQCLAKLWTVCSDEQRETLAVSRLQAMLAAPQAGFSNSQLLLLSSLARDRGQSNRSGEATDKQASELEGLLNQVTNRVLELLQADRLSEGEQLTFVNLLGSGLIDDEDELKMAAAFLQPEKSLAVRRTTIESLRRLRGQAAGETLLAQWSGLNAALRASAGATLLARHEWTSMLVAALESGQVPPNELDLATLQQLSTYGDRDLRNRCVELLGQPTERSQVVASYLAELPTPEKTPRGERLFAEHCAACHQSIEGKPQLGPPLENLGHWTLDQWVTAILDPNQAVEPKYRQSTLLTDDGQVVTGLVLQRNDQELSVGISDGSVKTVAVEQIEDEKSAGVSLMPVGFEQKLSPQDLAELLGFMRSR